MSQYILTGNGGWHQDRQLQHVSGIAAVAGSDSKHMVFDLDRVEALVYRLLGDSALDAPAPPSHDRRVFNDRIKAGLRPTGAGECYPCTDCPHRSTCAQGMACAGFFAYIAINSVSPKKRIQLAADTHDESLRVPSVEWMVRVNGF